jgi:hypothetical protein
VSYINLPAHSSQHAVLPEHATRGRRVVVVGDVHGCTAELEALLHRCAFRPGADTLLTVGDVVNKGYDSAGTLALLRALGAGGVRGNHDHVALAAHMEARAGRPPARGALRWTAGLDRALGGALAELPLTLRLPAYHCSLVHAGLVPGVALRSHRAKWLMTMRGLAPAAGPGPGAGPGGRGGTARGAAPGSYAAAGGFVTAEETDGDETADEGEGEGGDFDWAAALAEAEGVRGGAPGPWPALARLRPVRRTDARAWASVYRGAPATGHVFFGHDARRGLQLEPWATGLDAGCVYGARVVGAVAWSLCRARRRVSLTLCANIIYTICSNPTSPLSPSLHPPLSQAARPTARSSRPCSRRSTRGGGPSAGPRRRPTPSERSRSAPAWSRTS